MPRRLMGKLEVRLRQTIWPKGRRLAAPCPHCYAIAENHLRMLGSVDFDVYYLKVPRLPNTVRCPQCEKESGYYVDARTCAPKIGKCSKCELGLYRVAGHPASEFDVASWKVMNAAYENSVLGLPSGVDLAIECSECDHKELVAVMPVRGKEIT